MTDDRVVALLGDMVAIRSVNRAYPGGTGEAAMADYVERWGIDGGFEVQRQQVTPGQDNVLVTLAAPNATGPSGRRASRFSRVPISALGIARMHAGHSGTSGSGAGSRTSQPRQSEG